jgi:hypothetical protein
MIRIRIVSLSLVVVVCATAASAASAEQPVFYGKAAIGATVSTVKFASTIGASLLEAQTSKDKFSCTGGSSKGGEVTGPQTIKHEVITFTGCESSSLKCKSSGQVEGTIVTNSLEGVLGQLSATVPGLRLFKEGEHGKEPKNGVLEEFECGGGILKAVVTGSVVGSLSGAAGETPAEGKISQTVKLTFTQTAGKQSHTKFLAGECGGAGECGPEQLTANLNGASELWGAARVDTITTTPFAYNLGFTR